MTLKILWIEEKSNILILPINQSPKANYLLYKNLQNFLLSSKQINTNNKQPLYKMIKIKKNLIISNFFKKKIALKLRIHFVNKNPIL